MTFWEFIITEINNEMAEGHVKEAEAVQRVLEKHHFHGKERDSFLRFRNYRKKKYLSLIEVQQATLEHRQLNETQPFFKMLRDKCVPKPR